MSHMRLEWINILSAWMSKNSLLETGGISEGLSNCNRIQTQYHLLLQQTLNHLPKLAEVKVAG